MRRSWNHAMSTARKASATAKTPKMMFNAVEESTPELCIASRLVTAFVAAKALVAVVPLRQVRSVVLARSILAT